MLLLEAGCCFFTDVHHLKCFQEKYAYLENGEVAELSCEVSVAGRIMASRVMGKLAFARLMDESGSVQVMMDAGTPEKIGQVPQFFMGTPKTSAQLLMLCSELLQGFHQSHVSVLTKPIKAI